MMSQMFVRDVADVVETAEGENAYKWEWAPCERCGGGVRVVQDIVGSLGPIIECNDCGRRTQVVDAI